MPIILTGQAKDTHGQLYKIDIYDRDGAASSDEFNFGERPSLSWTGQSNSFNTVVISRSAEMYMDVIEPGPELNFIAALKNNNDEKRFWVRLYIDSDLEFVGYIQTDQLSIPITSNGQYTFTFQATDRLNALSNFPYDEAYAFEGDKKLRELLTKVLESIGVTDIYSSGEPILSIAHQYYEGGMDAGSGDPYDKIYLNRAHFSRQLSEEEEITVVGDSFGSLEFTTPKRVLETVDCQVVINALVGDFHAFILQHEGYYKVMYRGVFLLAESTGQYRYDKNDNFLSSGKIMSDITIGSPNHVSETDHYLHDGGKYGFIGPLKEVVIRYASESRNNLVRGHQWHTYDQTLETFDQVSNAGDATLYGSLKLHVKLPGGDIFTHINIRLKLGVTVKIGTYFLTRTATVTNGVVEYGDLVWSQTSGVVEYISEIVRSSPTGLSFINQRPVEEITFETVDLPIPESGVLSVAVETNDVLTAGGAHLAAFTAPDEIAGGYTLYWIARENFIRVIAEDAEQNPQALDYIDYTTPINANNSEKYFREIRIGDDALSQSFSRLRVWDGTEVIDADEGWYMPSHGTQKPFGELLSWDIARFRNVAKHVLKGRVMSKRNKITPLARILFDSKNFVMLTSNHDGRSNLWTGQYAEVNVNETGLSTLIKKKKIVTPRSDPADTALLPETGLTGGPRAEIVTGVSDQYVNVTVANLPDPADYSEAEINNIMSGTRWRHVLLHFKANPTKPGQYDIDISGSNNRLVLWANTLHKTTDEFFIRISPF